MVPNEQALSGIVEDRKNLKSSRPVSEYILVLLGSMTSTTKDC